MNKFVIFDGNAIMHRAYHALPPMKARNGDPINAVYGLISMLLKVIQDLKPTHIAFAFDRPEPTFRKEILPEYQAQRPEMEEELSSQFKKAQDIIKAFNIPLYDKAGFEADDVIGTIASLVSQGHSGRSKATDRISRKKDPTQKAHKVSQARQDDIQVLIITGDRDMLQLVDEKHNVKLYMPGRGLSDAKEYGKAETIERMGVPPEQIIDYKGLVGDPSDNYKGVPGVGPKTAESLLKDYKTLENIYKNLDKLPEKLKEKLENNKESALQSQKLAEIVTNVPVKFDIGDTENWQINSDKAVKLCEEYGFRTLTKRVQDVGKKLEDDKQMRLM